MATKSVATKKPNADFSGSTHDLWLKGGRKCVTVRLDRDGKEFPPRLEALSGLHETLVGLGKAVEMIATLLEAEDINDAWSAGLALNGLADAIVLHAGLADAISTELDGENAAVLAAA